MKVITELQVGEQLEFEIEEETPEGRPERDRVTGCVSPAVSILVIVF